MQVSAFRSAQILVSSSKNEVLPVFALDDSLPFCPLVHRRNLRPSSSSSSPSLRCGEAPKLDVRSKNIRARALNAGTGSGGYEESQENDSHSSSADAHHSDASSKIETSPGRAPFPFPTALMFCACTVGFLLILFTKGPSSVLSALAKSGFTAAFSLIFVSEIGDKTSFIAALLAMQFDKVLVLLGSMGALCLMTILSVIIGRIFYSVPAQFQRTLPIGEYAAVTLLVFFGLKSIKDAWDLPSKKAKTGEQEKKESDCFFEAEELMKEKVPNRLSNPLEVLWKSFSLVFVAEWGDRSMLATIALGAAQSPLGVASGAIAGHLVATATAILGGAFLARYISEKLVGYIGGALFLVFAVVTYFGIF